VRRIMATARRKPRLMALAQSLLRFSPGITYRLNQIGALADPFAGRIYIPSGRLSRYSDELALMLPASARVIYLRLRAEASDAGSSNRH
jgi:hypothetical protein